jgi:hypothetical protein
LAAAGLASDSVTTAKILNSNVTTAKIADLNVTTVKLADSAVTAAKIASAALGTTLTGGAGTVVNIATNYTLSNRSYFNAYNNTLRSNVTGNGVDYTVAYNTEIIDQNGDFNTSTFTFTAPVSGVYIFSYAVSVSDLQNSSHTSLYLTLKTTTKDYKTHFTESAGMPFDEVTISDSKIVYMTAGNTAYVQITATGGGTDVDVQKGDASASNQGTVFMGALLF